MSPARRQQIEALYNAALEQGPGALDGVSDDLRREVESLLTRESAASATLTQGMGDATDLVLAPGQQLGPYRIDGALGQGGMGQVFRATDTRLNRQVAIKTSLIPFDPRFQREARAIAALNHPNVCTLYDVGPSYLVMEFCEGENLADRIKRGKLSLEETCGIGSQIAAALTAAHAKDVVHRDLKPANVILTRNGAQLSAKVLDFGLAKSASDSLVTHANALIGTPAYMAPEQREGRATDHRTDIYSLGLLLHEMATGERLQPGEASRVAEPPQLAHTIGLCLATDPEARWQSAADVRSELEWTMASRLQTLSPIAAPRRFRAIGIAAAVFALVSAALASFAWFSRSSDSPANPLTNARFTRLTDFEGAETDAAISREGKLVAFRSDHEGLTDTWVTQVGSGHFVKLTDGTQRSVLVKNTGFTPDGSEVWLSSIPGGTRLRLVPSLGGTPRPFLAERAMDLAWSPDGLRLAYHHSDAGDPIFIADRAGNNVRPILSLDPGAHNHFLTWSLDGEWIYFVHGRWEAADMDIWRIRPAGGAPERLTQIHSDIKYLTPLDDRTILYTAPDEDGAGPWLWAFDTRKRKSHRISTGLDVISSVEASGDGGRLVVTIAKPTANLWSFPIGEGVADGNSVAPYRLPAVRAHAPRFAGDALFYLSSRGTGDGLWRFEKGASLELWRGIDGALFEPPAVSAGGRHLAVILRRQGKRTLHALSPDGGDARPLAAEIEITSAASWSPDGRWIAASGVDAKGPALFKISADGAERQRLVSGPAANPVWSPDGSLIAYTGPVVGPTGALLLIHADGSPAPFPQLRVRVNTEHYRFMPGGKKLVYIPTTGLHSPEHFWIVDLATQKSRQLSNFEMRLDTRTFDITPDGKQIVFDRLRENSDIVLIDLPKPK